MKNLALALFFVFGAFVCQTKAYICWCDADHGLGTAYYTIYSWYADSLEECCDGFTGLGWAQDYLAGLPIGSEYDVSSDVVLCKCCANWESLC